MSEHYDPKNPGPYIDPLYKRAKEWYESIAPRLQEQWDMWNARDYYQEERDRLGYAHLSFPQIFVAYEAICATVYKLLQSEQSLMVFEPVNQRSLADKIAAERLTSGFANMRFDLGYDDKIMDMVAGTTIFDFAHMKLEPEWLTIEPGLGVWAKADEMGSERLYPSFKTMHPGRVIYDGSYENDKDIPAKFEESFVTYQELKRDWPEQVGEWMRRYERDIGDVHFSARTAMNGLSDESIYEFYAAQAGGRNAEKSQRRGFLLVQAEVNAVYENGDIGTRTVWFLPNVMPQNDSSGVHQFGYILGEQGPSFNTVKTLYRTCRSRRVPFSNMGRGTAGLLIPFQRQFSAQVAMEMDLDQRTQTPQLIMREGAWIGQDDPALNSDEVWTVTDPTNNGLPLDRLISTLKIDQRNRGYLTEMNISLANMANLISSAVEATTGQNTTDQNKTLGAFEARNQGGISRINMQFMEHALSIIWLGKQHLRMMSEAPDQFMYPPYTAYSETLGAEGMLELSDLQAATRLRVPALSEFSKRESAKVLWAMVLDSFQKIPIFAESPELQLWGVEHMIRAMGVPEVDVQEAMMAAQGGMVAAYQKAAMQGMPPQVGGGQTPGVQPGKLMNNPSVGAQVAAA